MSTGSNLRLAALLFAGASSLPLHAAPEAGSRQAREFVQAAGQSDTFEIREAQAILDQSTSPDVRTFAQHMLDDHIKMKAALADAAARAGLSPPPDGVSSDQALLLGGLQSQHGPDLDKTYLGHQVLAHRAALAVQQKYAAEGNEPTLRQVAASAVPAISAHLQRAEQMKAQIGAN